MSVEAVDAADAADAVDALDELNAAIGVALERASDRVNDLGLAATLRDVQSRLVDLARDGSVLDGDVAELERATKSLDELLPALRVPVLPGGAGGGAELHAARAACRRAERLVAAAGASEPSVDYLNRLSDFLFAAARRRTLTAGGEDVPWRPRRQSSPAGTP